MQAAGWPLLEESVTFVGGVQVEALPSSSSSGPSLLIVRYIVSMDRPHPHPPLVPPSSSSSGISLLLIVPCPFPPSPLQTGQSPENKARQARTSSTAWLNQSWLGQLQESTRVLVQSAQQRLAALTRLPIEHAENMQVRAIQPGGRGCPAGPLAAGPLAAGRWLNASGCWLNASGRWLNADGRWLNAYGRWLNC